MQLGLKQNKTGFVLVVKIRDSFFFKKTSQLSTGAKGVVLFWRDRSNQKIKRAQTGDQTPETNNPKQNPCFEGLPQGGVFESAC